MQPGLFDPMFMLLTTPEQDFQLREAERFSLQIHSNVWDCDAVV